MALPVASAPSCRLIATSAGVIQDARKRPHRFPASPDQTLHQLLTHQSSPTRTQRATQRKFAFTFDSHGEKQTGEIGCCDEQNAQCRDYDDKNFRTQIHDKLSRRAAYAARALFGSGRA
jgi:hypothetical protein